MNDNMKKIVKSTALLLGFIIICALFIRYFSGSETLTEYAKKNPSKADTADTTVESDTPEDTLDKDISEDENFLTENELPTDTLETEIIPLDRVTYKEGFYYQPLDDTIITRITGCSYPVLENGEEIEISYEDLSYVVVEYVGFDSESHTGEIICNNAIAQDLVEIFYELYQNDYQIEEISLIETYEGNDLLSCRANNTSCFNYRQVVGSNSLSKHALGLAIDINPLYNPYITYNSDGTTNIYPENAADYVDRSKSFPYKIDEQDLCYKLFTEHGFTWGGNWNSSKDYQHFQKKI